MHGGTDTAFACSAWLGTIGGPGGPLDDPALAFPPVPRLAELMNGLGCPNGVFLADLGRGIRSPRCCVGQLPLSTQSLGIFNARVVSKATSRNQWHKHKPCNESSDSGFCTDKSALRVTVKRCTMKWLNVRVLRVNEGVLVPR